MKKIRIPKSFPVQPLKPGQAAKDKATCGNCGLSWDDAIPTTWTPAPSARCPFEYFHVGDDGSEKKVLQPELLAAAVNARLEFCHYEKTKKGKRFLLDAMRRLELAITYAKGDK